MSILYGVVIVEHQTLTPELAFFILYMFGQISRSISIIPHMLKEPMNAWSALHRVVDFLNMEEAHPEKFIEKRVAEKGEAAGKLKIFFQQLTPFKFRSKTPTSPGPKRRHGHSPTST